MKSKLINIFWGSLFIILSGVLLAEALGYVSFSAITGRGWAIACWVASAAFTVTYLLNGVKQWGWLFPALICAALGWNNFHTGRFANWMNLDWPLLAALAIPFLAGFAVDRKRWSLLIPAYALSVAAFMNFSAGIITGVNLWANPNLLTVSAVFTGAIPMFLFALPFFVLYFRSGKNWWALMPAGGFTSIGVTTVLSILMPHRGNELTGFHNAILLLGFAATMGALWLRRRTQPTRWTVYPAVGLLLLAIAALILGRGWVDLPQDIKVLVFLAGSAAFFLAYILHGVKKWGWLFPACFCAGLALTIWMGNMGIDGSYSALPIFAGAALPFIAGFALDRKRWGLLIPGTFLTAFTIFLALEETAQGMWSGTLFFLMMAAPCFAAYFLTKRSWWALIPAGSCVSFGLVTVMENLIPHQEYPTLPNTMSWDMLTWVVFLGLAATFGAVWLHRKTQPTGWALYPAMGLLILSVMTILLGEHFQELWLAATALVTGAMLLLAALNRKKTTVSQPQV